MRKSVFLPALVCFSLMLMQTAVADVVITVEVDPPVNAAVSYTHLTLPTTPYV